MELKKDSTAVSIDMLLIVHSERRRAAQGAHSDRQADPGALPPRRGGLQGVGNGIRRWQKFEGNDVHGKSSLFIFFLIFVIQHMEK